MSTPEKYIENCILSFLKLRGVLVWQNSSVGIFDSVKKIYRKKTGIHHKIGVSDILGIYKGKFLALEVKSKKGKLSPAQLIFLDEVTRHGGIAHCVRSVEEVAKLLDLPL